MLAVGAFAAFVLIVWAANTGRTNTLPSEVVSTPGPEETPSPTALPQAAKPTNTQAVATPPAGAAATPHAAALPDVSPIVGSTPSGTDFNRLVSESQKRAVATYPALGKLGSPINTLFVKRHTALKANDNLRLHSSDWPEKLARECAGELPRR